MAWLQTPVQQRRGKRTQVGESRHARLQREGVLHIPMPPLEAGGHLVEYLTEVGPVVHTGMDRTPITWQEMQAWQQLRGIELDPWEAGMLRRLSREYLVESIRAADRDAPPLWHAPTEVDRAVVARKIGTLFGGLAKSKRKASQ